MFIIKGREEIFLFSDKVKDFLLSETHEKL